MTVDLVGIAARISESVEGDIALVGLANAINSSIRDDTSLGSDEVSELQRLKVLALSKACGPADVPLRIDVSLLIDGLCVATALGVRADEGGGFYWQSPGGQRLEVRAIPSEVEL